MKHESFWQAIQGNDKRYDGIFFYAVKSIGIFCRPSCPSRLPLRENVLFFEEVRNVQATGFRPCKRCRPDLMEYDPQAETALKMKQLIERYHADDKCLKQELTRLGTNQSRVKRIFQDLFGESPREYLDSVRFQWVSNRLCVSTDSIMEVAHAAGFNSLSAFYRFFSSQVGIPPARYHREYRRNEKNEDEL